MHIKSFLCWEASNGSHLTQWNWCSYNGPHVSTWSVYLPRPLPLKRQLLPLSCILTPHQPHSLPASPGTHQSAPFLRPSPCFPLPRKYFLQIFKELTSSPPVLKQWNEWHGLLWIQLDISSWASHWHVWCGYCHLPPPQTCSYPHGPHSREWSSLMLHSFSLDTPHVPQVTVCCELWLLNTSPNLSLFLPPLPPSYFRLPWSPLFITEMGSPCQPFASSLAPHLSAQLLKQFYTFQVNWFPCYSVSPAENLSIPPHCPQKILKHLHPAWEARYLPPVLCPSSCDEFHLAPVHTLLSLTLGPLQMLFPLSGILFFSPPLH